MSQQDVTSGLGPAYVTEKFLCHPVGSSNTLAFMRVYKQVPIAGTEFKKTSIRATQAVKSFEPTELTTLKSLQEKGCDVIPRLLGYQCDQQDEDDIVPGGFITYVIWEKVQGESLNIQSSGVTRFRSEKRSDLSSARYISKFSVNYIITDLKLVQEG